jgi:Trp operon repressor
VQPLPSREAENYVRAVQPLPSRSLPSRQVKKELRGLQSVTRGSAEFKQVKREKESSPEIKLEPEIKQEPFTIRGYFGIGDEDVR